MPTGQFSSVLMWRAVWGVKTWVVPSQVTCGLSGMVNLVRNLPIGNYQFKANGNAQSNEDWYSPAASHPANPPKQPNANGVRVCGAASQSTTGWCGEADRATNGSPALSYPSLNMACCMGG